MSYAHISTKNEIGVRRAYSLRGLGHLAVHRAPAEVPPIAALYPTRPLAGVRDYNTTSALGDAAVAPGGTPTNYISRGPIADPVVRVPFWRPAVASQTTATPTTTSTTQNPGGVALNPNGPSAATAQRGTPVPIGTPTNTNWTDSSGDIWGFTPSAGWQVIGTAANPPSTVATGTTTSTLPATTSTAGTPVPVGYPTTSPYIDPSGNIWTYGTAGWQLTTPAATAPAGAAGSSVVVNTDSTWSDITSWLQQSSIISSIPNFWLVAGVGIAGLMVFSGGGKRR